MLRKTILEIENGLNEEEQIESICSNIDQGLVEIINYKIGYVLYAAAYKTYPIL